MNVYQKFLNKIDWIINTRMSKKYTHMPNVKVQSFDESINSILKDQSSLTRFGDGELSLMLNGEFLRNRNVSLRFQKSNPILKNRLIEIINSTEADKFNLKIAITSALTDLNTDEFIDEAWHFWKNFLIENRFKVYRFLRKNYPYVDARITRFYMDYKDKSPQAILPKVQKIKKIWDGKDLLIVEGFGSRLGLNNDLFDNVNSISRIACPNENAFDKYEEILSASKRFGQKRLILIALGPTATVLAYDLAKDGFRALDVGHVDIEYEWFLMGAHQKIKINGKVMTEATHDLAEEQVVDNIDQIHLSQIVHTIR